MYSKQILKNNVRLVTVPQKEAATATLLVLVKVGSRYETKKLSGISHFIEHMMFKGTKKRPNTLAITKEMDGIGAEFNAFTGRDATGYYVKASSKHLPLAIDVLSDMLLNSKFEAVEVEKEKGTIVEEINMYEDNPRMCIEEVFDELIFEGNSMSRSIAGTRDTVRGMTNLDMIGYKNKFYGSANIVVTVSGKFTDADLKLIEKSFVFSSSVKKNSFSLFVNDQKAPRFKIKFRETEQAQLTMGFPAYSYFDDKLYALNLLAVILGGNMSSRLFLEVREKHGLAYSVRSGLDIYEDTGSLIVSAGLDKIRIEKALTLICKELKRIKKDLNSAEIKRGKEFLAGKTALDLEDSASAAQWYGQQELFTGKMLTPAEKIAKIMAVTKADLVTVAEEVINFNKANLAIIGPFKDQKPFEKIIKSFK